MKMTALTRVEGVDKVLAGKGKGGTTAFAGDIFEIKEGEAKRLAKIEAAEEYKVHDPLADAEGGSTGEKKPAGRKPAAKKTGGKTAAKAETKASDGSDTASDEELGL